MLTEIEFSENSNGKLLLNLFTTIRLYVPEKYAEGNTYDILLRGELLGTAKAIIVHTFPYKLLNERTARIDTGKSLRYVMSLLNSFYPGRIFPETKLCVVFLEWTERKYQGQTKIIEKHWEHCKEQMPKALQQHMTFID